MNHIKKLPNGDTEGFSFFTTPMVQPAKPTLGDFLSAALEDPDTCDEYRECITQWLVDHEAGDWSLLEATQESLRDHMAMIRADREVMGQALEALEACLGWPHVIAALKERLQ